MSKPNAVIKKNPLSRNQRRPHTYSSELLWCLMITWGFKATEIHEQTGINRPFLTLFAQGIKPVQSHQEALFVSLLKNCITQVAKNTSSNKYSKFNTARVNLTKKLIDEYERLLKGKS